MKRIPGPKKTIAEIQTDIEKALKALRNTSDLPAELADLRHLAPKGMEPQVLLVRPDTDRRVRRIRRNAAAEYWQPAECQALIGYERRDEAASITDREAGDSELSRGIIDSRVEGPPNLSESRIKNLIEALDEAESSPERRFVALKWFRDTYLPGRGFSWTVDGAERNRILRRATGRDLVLTAKIHNPKAPMYPTTTVRLNRGHPDFENFVSRRPEPKRFRPIRIKGRPLSETVLEGRR